MLFITLQEFNTQERGLAMQIALPPVPGKNPFPILPPQLYGSPETSAFRSATPFLAAVADSKILRNTQTGLPRQQRQELDSLLQRALMLMPEKHSEQAVPLLRQAAAILDKRAKALINQLIALNTLRAPVYQAIGVYMPNKRGRPPLRAKFVECANAIRLNLALQEYAPQT